MHNKNSQGANRRLFLFVDGEGLFEEGVDAFDGEVFCGIEEEDLHAGAVFGEEVGVGEVFAFDEADVGLAGVFFVSPEIAEHFFVVAEEGHTVFPGFGDVGVEGDDVFAEELEAGAAGLGELEEVVVDGFEHGVGLELVGVGWASAPAVRLVEAGVGEVFVEEEDGEAAGAVGAEDEGLFDVGGFGRAGDEGGEAIGGGCGGGAG